MLQAKKEGHDGVQVVGGGFLQFRFQFRCDGDVEVADDVKQKLFFHFEKTCQKIAVCGRMGVNLFSRNIQEIGLEGEFFQFVKDDIAANQIFGADKFS